MSAHHRAAPVGGGFWTPVTLILAALVVVAVALLGIRFTQGLGAVTNLNDGYPWGIWVVYDVVIGSAFACGGYAMALLVYIFNKGKYHPLVRPALTASLFGYTLAGVSVIFDLGRYWNFWHIFAPGYAHPDSVMFEVALCISIYILVMWLEFAPAWFEKTGNRISKQKVERIMFFLVALGILLPSMHQSSLGSLLVVFGTQIHPLWQSVALPLLFLLSAVTIGFAVVIFESCLSSAGFKRPLEMEYLEGIGKIMVIMLGVFLAVRFGDLLVRGAIGAAFGSGFKSLMFWIETACFVLPVVLLASAANRRKPSKLFLGAFFMLLGAFLYRINAFLVGYDTGPGWHYFPSVSELMVTLGIIALEILAYIAFVRYLPVLPKAGTATH